jgi:hypothetical protein
MIAIVIHPDTHRCSCYCADRERERIKVLDAEVERLRAEGTIASLAVAIARAERAEAERDALKACVEAVSALHGPPTESEAKYSDLCLACGELWPCPTRRALEGKP